MQPGRVSTAGEGSEKAAGAGNACSRRSSQPRCAGFHRPPARFTCRCKATSCTATRTPTISAPLRMARAGHQGTSSTNNAIVLSRRWRAAA
jgi:hypothetical protein